MINVFDTHRLMYRNAILKAYDLADGTTPIEFYNVTENTEPTENIGDTVYTNEAGYICYGTNRQMVLGLGLKKSAIIRASLNDGVSWPIEWTIRIAEDGVTREDLTFKIFDSARNVLYDPLSKSYTMPDYLLRSEYSNGIWKEESVSLETNESSVALSEWTTSVRISQAVIAVQISLTGQLRAGQKVLVVNEGKTRVINNMRFEAGSFGMYYADGNGNMMWTTQSDAFYALILDGIYDSSWTESARKLIALADTIATIDNKAIALQRGQMLDVVKDASIVKAVFGYTPALIYSGICATDTANALLYDIANYNGGVLPAHINRAKLRLIAPSTWSATADTYHIVLKVPYEWFKYNRTVDLDITLSIGSNHLEGNFSIYLAFTDDNGQYHPILLKQRAATYDESSGTYVVSNYNVQLRCRADLSVSYVEMNPAINAT